MAFFSPLGAFSALAGGFTQGLSDARDADLKKYDLMGMQALGKAFSQPGGQGPIDQMNAQAGLPSPQPAPQAPMPGQPSVPSRPPVQPSPPSPQPGGGMPASPPQPGGVSPAAAGPPAATAPLGSFDLNTLAARIRAANPNLPPQAMFSALNRALPLLNAQGRMDLARATMEMRRQSLDLSQQRLDEERRYHDLLTGGGTGGGSGGGASGGNGIDYDRLGRLGWSQDALKAAAEVWLATGQTPTNLGTRAVAQAVTGAIRTLGAQLAVQRGIDPEQLPQRWAQYGGEKSYQRTAGSYGARVESASNEVVQLIPQAVEASKALPRGEWVPLNKLVQAWQRGTSDPAYNDFIMANFSLINAYTRAMNPSGAPRVNDRLEQKAEGILSEATSQKAYETQVRRLWKEVQASKKAIADTTKGRTPGDINAPVPGLDHGGMMPGGGEIIGGGTGGGRDIGGGGTAVPLGSGWSVQVVSPTPNDQVRNRFQGVQ